MEKKNKIMLILVIILTVAVLAMGSYIVYDKVLKNNSDSKNTANKNDDTVEKEDLPLTDALVKKLYGYVSYGQSGLQNHFYFLKNKELTVGTFDDEEKHFYAFNLLTEDNVTVTGADLNGNPAFTIEDSIYEAAIKKIFGPNVTYSKGGEFSFLSRFAIENCSGLSFTYDSETNKYSGSAGGVGGMTPLLAPLYTKLVDAYILGDELILKEKFIFVDLKDEQVGDTWNYVYSYNVYTDYDKQNLIDSKTSLSESDIQDTTLSVDTYLEKANTITYTFKLGNDDQYYFSSSKIEK